MFEPRSCRTWGALYFCPMSYLNQKHFLHCLEIAQFCSQGNTSPFCHIYPKTFTSSTRSHAFLQVCQTITIILCLLVKFLNFVSFLYYCADCDQTTALTTMPHIHEDIHFLTKHVLYSMQMHLTHTDNSNYTLPAHNNFPPFCTDL